MTTIFAMIFSLAASCAAIVTVQRARSRIVADDHNAAIPAGFSHRPHDISLTANSGHHPPRERPDESSSLQIYPHDQSRGDRGARAVRRLRAVEFDHRRAGAVAGGN